MKFKLPVKITINIAPGLNDSTKNEAYWELLQLRDKHDSERNVKILPYGRIELSKLLTNQENQLQFPNLYALQKSLAPELYTAYEERLVQEAQLAQDKFELDEQIRLAKLAVNEQIKLEKSNNFLDLEKALVIYANAHAEAGEAIDNLLDKATSIEDLIGGVGAIGDKNLTEMLAEHIVFTEEI
jgi:hypothetical protein